MGNLKLSFASWDYDRLQALTSGIVKPSGIDLLHLNLPVEEIFWRLTKHQEFDVSEMSFSSYLIAKERGLLDYTAIPVFPSRFFRHSCIFVNAGAGIERPEDLRGKKIGVPEYQMTAALWIRGFLEDDYQVKAQDMQWYFGGLESPGREEKITLNLPKEISIQPIPQHETLNQMLENGDIAALITARPPSNFIKGSANIKRLFTNSKEVEQDYFRRTKIFPIMHTVVIRNQILSEHPWVANELLKAFEKSKQYTYEGYKQTVALRTTIPWQADAVEEAVNIMGEDFWPYGLHKNRVVLDAATRYSYEQGLTKKQWKPEELFVASTFDEFKI